MNERMQVDFKMYIGRIWTLALVMFLCVISCKSDPKVENQSAYIPKVEQVHIKEVEKPIADRIEAIPSEVVSIKEVPNQDKKIKPKAEIKKAEPKISKTKTAKKTPPKKKKKAVVAKPEVVPQAKINFDRMNHSFGELKSGDIFEHKFYFTNTGTSDLIINEVTVSCGCTQPSYPFIPIPPGEKGFIGVTYNSVGKEGAQRPKVTVYTNAEPANYSLYLIGDVLPKEEESKEEITEEK